jgi:hypothetical protein
MQIKGIKADVFTAIVNHVSTNVYDGNVCPDYWRTGKLPTPLNQAGTRYLARVVVKSSRGAGARRSASGRRMPVACWHVFRDVVRATLTAHPGVEFRTRLAHYTSVNFETSYPATGQGNVGSMVDPVTLPELCDCPADHRVGDPPRGSILPRDLDLAQRTGLAPYVAPYRDERVPETHLAPEPRMLAERVSAALAVKAGECAWCSGPTGASVLVWCRPECQAQWQEKYPTGY